ncbi:hypothetical protein [Rhizobium sp. J15]|uniref:hypothetical protein n=1 Tax=Rhizobium sp. J15 TaxID=2035450 RepID=UPI001144D49D|nr:hypothetical protein [Rhizobium sp. J15]
MISAAANAVDIECYTINVAGICCCVGQNVTPFHVGLDNAARQKKFLPFRNFFIKAALTAH